MSVMLHYTLNAVNSCCNSPTRNSSTEPHCKNRSCFCYKYLSAYAKRVERIGGGGATFRSTDEGCILGAGVGAVKDSIEDL